MHRTDIATRADIERLVRTFYTQAIPDPIIGHFFTKVIQLDLDSHLPRIANFLNSSNIASPPRPG